LAERAAEARASVPPAGATPLAELEGVLRAADGAAPGERGDLLRRAYALLPQLRDGRARVTNYTATPVAAGEGQLAGPMQPVQYLRGVGPRRAIELERFGLESVEDVLYHLPFRYEDRRAIVSLAALKPGMEATSRGTVARVRSGVTARRGRRLLEVQ